MAIAGLGMNPQTLLLGLSGLAGGLGNRAGTTKSTGTQTSTLNDPNLLAMRNKAFANYEELLNPTNLEGITANKLSTINRTSDIQRQNTEGELAARGITGPAAMAALNSLENTRFANVTQARNEQPLLERQLKEQALQNFGGFISSAPQAGQTQTSSGSVTTPGNVAGGVTGNLANTLAFLFGQGEMGGGGGGLLGGAGSLLGKLGPGFSGDLTGGIPGLALKSAPMAIGGLTGTGAAAGTAGTAGATGGITGALGSVGSSIGTLGGTVGLSAGIPIIGGAIAAGLLAKKYIGAGRKQADKLTGEGGLQNIFDKEILPSIVDNPNLTQDQKNTEIARAFQELSEESRGFASKGKNQSKVVQQMLNSYLKNPVTSGALTGMRA